MSDYLLSTNRESLDLREQRRSKLDFRLEGKGFRTISESTPESAVAFNEEYVQGINAKKGLN